MSNKEYHSRRNFLGWIIRGGILASLASLGGILLSRESGEGPCQADFICNTCKTLDQCRLPQADKFRLARARNKNQSTNDGRGRKQD